MMMEVREELGLSAEMMGAMCGGADAGSPEGLRLVSVVRDEAMVKPELIWRWEVGLEVEDLIGHAEDGEHAGWAIVKRDRVERDLWELMTPVARQAWRCWNQGGGARDDRKNI